MSQTTNTIKTNKAIKLFKSHKEEVQMICKAMETKNGELTNQKEWNLFYNQYNRFIFAIANKIMHDEDDAEDITQEIFIKCIEEFSKYDQNKPFKPWLASVVKNHCINKIKEKISKKTHYVGIINLEENTSQNEEDIMYFNAVDTKTKSPFEEASSKETQKNMNKIVNKLKPEFQQVIRMKYYEGLSYEQVAKKIGVPIGTVMSRLYNAKKKLKQFYDKF
jgi:RNA polymerase sigma-70 factor (ECF subfamily)